MKANKPGFADLDLQITEIDRYPEISEDIQQTLTRLLGFDSSNLKYKAVLVDTDGRLLVSTSATQGSTATASQVTVGIATTQLLGQNLSRRECGIANLGANTIFLGFGSAAILATGFPVLAGQTVFLDKFTGVINAISSVAGNDVRLYEV